MYLRREHLKRTARAPAKLNLYLEILGRRSDGFHELETLMVPVSLGDSLTLAPTPPPPADGRKAEIRLAVRSCSPLRARTTVAGAPVGPANLVVQALELFRERSGCRFGAEVELVKRIPAAAGLGGASSDAAVALRLANRAWQLDWPDGRLAELAAEVGSDVPFFLHARPAICRGRGERIEPLTGLRRMHFVLVMPPAGLNTAEVYAAHDRLPAAMPARPGQLNEVAASLAANRWPNPGAWMRNRLQAAAAALSPWVERLRTVFEELDCEAHQLSGSGSAYFGICRHARHARRLSALLRARQLGLVYATKSYR